MRPPGLIAVGHGTRCPSGQAQVRRVVASLRRRRHDLDIAAGYLDIERPGLRTVATRWRGPAVAVPLLFAAGYHVHTDIPAALRGTPVLAAPPLGPDPLLTEALHARLLQACQPGGDARPAGNAGHSEVPWPGGNAHPGESARLGGNARPGEAPGPGGNAHPGESARLDVDAIVLAAAGSSDPRAEADVRTVARDLAAATGRPVVAGYASAATPRVPEAVATLRAAGARRVAIAAMMLADGHFYGSLPAAGADVLTRPLVTHPSVLDLILRRYDNALAPGSTVAAVVAAGRDLSGP